MRFLEQLVISTAAFPLTVCLAFTDFCQYMREEPLVRRLNWMPVPVEALGTLVWGILVVVPVTCFTDRFKTQEAADKHAAAAAAPFVILAFASAFISLI